MYMQFLMGMLHTFLFNGGLIFSLNYIMDIKEPPTMLIFLVLENTLPFINFIVTHMYIVHVYWNAG